MTLQSSPAESFFTVRVLQRAGASRGEPSACSRGQCRPHGSAVVADALVDGSTVARAPEIGRHVESQNYHSRYCQSQDEREQYNNETLISASIYPYF